MRDNRPDEGHRRIATLDIETTHIDAEMGETVSIGVGVHDRGRYLTDVDLRLVHRRPERDEEAVIREAFGWIDDQEPDVLVTYNGTAFDLDFLDSRLDILDCGVVETEFDVVGKHVDLYPDRKKKADSNGEKRPSLEECVESYMGEAPASLLWRGSELTNKRFGRELGPAYLEAVEQASGLEMTNLVATIDAYLRTDLLFNFLIYYCDIGEIDTGEEAEKRVEIDSSLSDW